MTSRLSVWPHPLRVPRQHPFHSSLIGDLGRLSISYRPHQGRVLQAIVELHLSEPPPMGRLADRKLDDWLVKLSLGSIPKMRMRTTTIFSGSRPMGRVSHPSLNNALQTLTETHRFSAYANVTAQYTIIEQVMGKYKAFYQITMAKCCA